MLAEAVEEVDEADRAIFAQVEPVECSIAM